MTKIAAEDVAREAEDLCKFNPNFCGICSWCQEAALVRSLERVRVAAAEIDGESIRFEGCDMLAVTPELVDDLKAVLAACDKLMNGEKR